MRNETMIQDVSQAEGMKLVHDSFLDDSAVVMRTFERLYRYMSEAFREDFIDGMLSRVYLTDSGDLIVEAQVGAFTSLSQPSQP